ncbi:MAG TPA: hypothetical protein VE010_01885 [Thermoanaerobaculia bacterium]|nr:hypothetical protein [Thermoanaerobaculia bacterium]
MRKTLLALSLLIAPALFAQTADLRVVKFNLSSTPTSTGERFALDIRWRNDGPAPATFITVRISGTPAPFYLLSVATRGWVCHPTPDGTSFTCQFPQLAVGGEAELVVQMLTPPTAGTFTLRGEVTGAEADPNRTNNSAQVSMDLSAGPSADLAVTPTTQTQITTAGAQTTMPLNVMNNSSRAVEGIVLYLAVPFVNNITNFTAEGPGWACANLAYGPQAHVCNRPRLNAGESAPLTIRATAPPTDGSVTIYARIAGEEHSDPFVGNNGATLTVQVGTTEVPPPPPPSWARILVPLAGPDARGQNNSLWRTEITGLVTSDTQLDFQPAPCTAPITCPPHSPLRQPFNAYDLGLGRLAGALGQFVYLPAEQEPLFHMNARVYDVSRSEQTAGAEIPIVRDEDFAAGPVSIVGIPVAPHYRHTLRVYDLDGRNGAMVRIRIFANGETTPRATEIRALTLPAGASTATVLNLPTHPAVLQLDPGALTPLAGLSTMRVEIEPLDLGVRLWSFVSVTNNETHHVTTFSQH